MLSLAEKILFALAVVVSLYFTYRGVRRIVAHISSGQGMPDWSLAWKRIGDLIVKVGGYSTYFVDLSKGLQDHIIARTEQRF